MTNTNSPDLKQNHQVIQKFLFCQGISLIGTMVMATMGLVAAEAREVNNSLVIPIEPIQIKPAATITPASVSKPPKVKAAVKLSPPQISVSPPPPLRAITSLPQGGKNSYVDTTSYTPRGNQNSSQSLSVIVSDRATGCQISASKGTIHNGCGRNKRTINNTRTKNKSNTSARPYPVSRARNYRPNTTTVSPRYTHAARPKHIVPNGHKALLFPLSIPASISSAFGWRIHPLTGSRHMHYGTDLAAPIGTPVLAAYGGEVTIADNLRGYGLTVILRHKEGTQESRYAHLSEIFVNPGEWVEQGSVIGLVGSTGLSTGPHLHFEWRHITQKGWLAVDTGLYLEYALDNLIKYTAIAQANPDSDGWHPPRPPLTSLNLGNTARSTNIIGKGSRGEQLKISRNWGMRRGELRNFFSINSSRNFFLKGRGIFCLSGGNDLNNFSSLLWQTRRYPVEQKENAPAPRNLGLFPSWR